MMSLDELNQKSAALSREEQKEPATFLAALRIKQIGEWNEATAEAAGPDREGWMILDEAKRRLSQEA